MAKNETHMKNLKRWISDNIIHEMDDGTCMTCAVDLDIKELNQLQFIVSCLLREKIMEEYGKE